MFRFSKRWPEVLLLAAFILAATIGYYSIPGEPPLEAKSYSSTFSWNHTALDSSATRELRTDSLVGGTTGAPVFYFGNLEGTYSSVIGGIIEAYVTALDSDDAAAQVADTTKDSLVFIIYTAWKTMLGTATNYHRAEETVLDSVVLSSVGYGVKRGSWTIPTTAALGNVVYARIQSIYRPPNDNDTVVIRYKAGASWIAR